MARKTKTREAREVVTPSSGFHQPHAPTNKLDVKLDSQKLTMSDKEVLDPNLVSSADQPDSSVPMCPIFVPDDASSVAEEDLPPVVVELSADQVSKRLSNLSKTAEGSNSAYLELNASNMRLEDVSVLSSYKYLQKVDLSYNKLTDVSALNCIRSLVEIDVSHNRLEKLMDFDPPKCNLRKADYSNNRIQRIPCLDDYIYLHHLDLSYNDISEIQGLSKCDSLRSLDISHNSIDIIEGLEKLKLHELNLSHNKIVAIDKLDKIKRLMRLDLRSNNIFSLDGLHDKPVLDTLLLDDNSIMTVDEVDYLVELKSLRTFSLADNDVQNAADYRRMVVFKLQWLTELDNVPVTVEEKVNAVNLFAPPPEVLASIDHMTHLVYSFMQPQQLRECTLPSVDTPYPMMVLCGPQLSGKRELTHMLAKNFPDYFAVGVSHTTRPARKEERDGKDYHFVNKHQFEALVKQGEFIQTFSKGSHMYGLTMQAVENVAKDGLACVTHMELEGVYSIKTTHFEPRYVLILPSTDEEHQLRFYNRGINTKSEIQKVCFDEYDRYVSTNVNHPGFFDMVIANDVVSDAYETLQKLVVGYLGVSEAPKVVQQRIGFNDSVRTRRSQLSCEKQSVRWSGKSKTQLQKSVSSTSSSNSRVASEVERASFKRREFAAIEAINGKQKSQPIFNAPLTAPALLQGSPLAQANSLYQDPAFGMQCENTNKRRTFELPSPKIFDNVKYEEGSRSEASLDDSQQLSPTMASDYSSRLDQSQSSSAKQARRELLKEPLDLSKLNIVKMSSSVKSSDSRTTESSGMTPMAPRLHNKLKEELSSLHHGLNNRPVLPPIPSRTPVN